MFHAVEIDCTRSPADPGDDTAKVIMSNTIRTITETEARALLASDEGAHAPWRELNEAGAQAVEQWVHATAADPDSHVMVAWYAAASRASDVADANDSVIVVEMPGRMTASGNPETLRLDPAQHFDWHINN